MYRGGGRRGRSDGKIEDCKKSKGFWAVLVKKKGIDFVQFGLESDMVFEETTGVYERIYRFNSKQIRKKAKHAN